MINSPIIPSPFPNTARANIKNTLSNMNADGWFYM